MKKAFGAIMIAVILIVCVVTMTVQRGENAMLEFPTRPEEGCSVLSLTFDGDTPQTEDVGTYNNTDGTLTLTAPLLEGEEPVQSGESYVYTLPKSISEYYFSDTTQGLLLYNGRLYIVTATTSGQTLEIVNLKTETLGGRMYYAQFVKEQISGSTASE